MASTRISITHALVVTPELVARLHALFADEVGDVQVTAECHDSIDREFADPVALNAYENLSPTRLLALTLSGYRFEPSQGRTSASISFSPGRKETAYCSISATNDVTVVRLRQHVRDLLGESRPWYSPLATTSVWVLLLVAWAVLVAWALLQPQQEAREAATPAQIGAIFAIMFGQFVLFEGLERFQHWAFPKIVFTIGAGADRFRHLERIQWTVFMGLIVSVSASIIAAAVL